MRTLNSMMSMGPVLSPFGRRRRALAAASKQQKNESRTSARSTPAKVPSNSINPTKTSNTSATASDYCKKGPSSIHNNTVTTTSCSERLHLVLARRSKAELQELGRELVSHSTVNTVCIYTDSPLLARAPMSQRQQRHLLTQTARVCTQMKNLQLDFSSEFGSMDGMVLECELLATLVENAPQLESLSLKDVPLSGDVEYLQQALLEHPSLQTMEIKWCSEDAANSSPTPILSTLLSTVTQMEHLQELTLLLSSAHNLPLPTLAQNSSIQRLTLGLEQRHATQGALTARERLEEQTLLMQFLDQMVSNTTLKECTLFSHHWKSELTLVYIRNLLASAASNLRLLHLTDYNYGSDDPRQLLELAVVLQSNTKLEQFKLFSKKRLSSQVDKKTRRSNIAAIDAAFLDCLHQNTTLQHLDIVHAGIHISDTLNIRKSLPCKTCCSVAVLDCHQRAAAKECDARQMIPLLLMTNRCKARQQFLLNENVSAKAWSEFLVEQKNNTPLIYYLLQENPNLLLLATVKSNQCLNSKHMWQYYF